MTRPFAGVERFLERLLERPAARLFRTRLQPVQIERRLERAMETRRVFNADRIYVPNRYRVLLHPADLETFESDHEALETDLAEALLRRARARGYRLVARPQVLLLPSQTVAEGDVEVSADALDPGLVRSAAAGLRPVDLEGPRGPRRSDPGTAPVPVAVAVGMTTGWGSAPVTAAGPSTDRSAVSSFALSGAGRVPVPEQIVGTLLPAEPPNRWVPGSTPEISALIEVAVAGAAPWAFIFRGGGVRIGRATDNEIVLADDRVSRRHGQLTSRQGMLVYTDLASSNGSFVNASRVVEIALGDGDVLRLGSSILTVRRTP